MSAADVRAGWLDAMRGQTLRASWRVGASDYRLGALLGAVARWLS